MTYAEVIAHYKGVGKTARALGVSQASISEWRKVGVPKLRQYQIQVLTGGRLKATLDVSEHSSTMRVRGATATATDNVGRAALSPRKKRGKGCSGSGSGIHGPRRVRPNGTNPRAVARAKGLDVNPKPKPLKAPLPRQDVPVASVPQPIPSGGAAARLAMLESGPQATRDATSLSDRPEDVTPTSGPKIIAAPAIDKPPLTVKPRQTWRTTQEGILAKAKALGVPLNKGETWGALIARVQAALDDAPLP